MTVKVPKELTFSELQRKIWTPGELAEHPIKNLQELKREVGKAISISPFDTELRTTEKLLADAIKYTRKIEGGNPMTAQEMEQLAGMVAEKMREDTSTTVLLLHSIPYSAGSPGIMVDPDIAARTPCKCYDNICFSRGIIGALNPAQREAYCPTTEHVTSPGMTRRLKNWQEAVGVCKGEIEKYEKGERLIPYIECMGRELPKRGIEI